ncbi:MAG: hypothetical protein LUF92_16525 [Clostridiales bacterium]|nr:hypothetical protein [Clostridiales bacterium]
MLEGLVYSSKKKVIFTGGTDSGGCGNSLVSGFCERWMAIMGNNVREELK